MYIAVPKYICQLSSIIFWHAHLLGQFGNLIFVYFSLTYYFTVVTVIFNKLQSYILIPLYGVVCFTYPKNLQRGTYPGLVDNFMTTHPCITRYGVDLPLAYDCFMICCRHPPPFLSTIMGFCLF